MHTIDKPLRISVTFSIEAAEWLDAEAERRATSLADLIRRIVDETRGAYVVDQRKADRR
jgi:hypothetical protein